MGWVDDLKIWMAMENIMKFVREINSYVLARATSKLAKDFSQRNELNAVLKALREELLVVSALLGPVMAKENSQRFGRSRAFRND